MVTVTTRPGPLRCAVCREEDDGALVACPRCGTRVHLECVKEACPTLGCTPGVAPVALAPEKQPMTAEQERLAPPHGPVERALDWLERPPAEGALPPAVWLPRVAVLFVACALVVALARSAAKAPPAAPTPSSPMGEVVRYDGHVWLAEGDPAGHVLDGTRPLPPAARYEGPRVTAVAGPLRDVHGRPFVTIVSPRGVALTLYGHRVVEGRWLEDADGRESFAITRTE